VCGPRNSHFPLVFIALNGNVNVMMQTRTIVASLLAGLVTCSGAAGDGVPEATANPFQTITERNVFHLSPPPPPPEPVPTKPPTPKIFLTGITTLGGVKRALLKATPPPKPGEPPKDRSYLLKEGERLDDLEVLAIDETGGIVKVSYAGDPLSLNFKDNGVASTTPAGPPPGAPGGPPINTAVPPPAFPQSNFRPTAFAPTPVANPPSATPAGSPGDGGVGAGMGGMGGGMGVAAMPPAPPISMEEQAVLIELNREAYKTSDPGAPPLPPTILTDHLNAAMQDGGDTVPGPTTPTTPGRTPISLPIPGRPGFPTTPPF